VCLLKLWILSQVVTLTEKFEMAVFQRPPHALFQFGFDHIYACQRFADFERIKYIQ